ISSFSAGMAPILPDSQRDCQCPRTLLNDLRRLAEDRLRDGQAHGAGSFQVDDKIELARLLDGKVARFSALQNPIDVSGDASPALDGVAAVDEKPPTN